ncbi:MAG: extracellular solute-binding protein [Ruminococcus sp.]
MKRVISVLLVVITMLTVVAISPVTSSAYEKGAKLVVWTPESSVKKVKTLCNTFAKKNNVKITVRSMEVNDSATLLLNDPMASADVLMYTSDQIDKLARAKVVIPLSSSYVKKVKKNDTSASVKAATVGKKLYGFPALTNTYYLVYNKKYITEKQANNLESILEVCKKKNKKFIMDVSNGYYASSVLFAGGLIPNGLKGAYLDKQKFNKYNKSTVSNTMKAFSSLINKYKKNFKNLSVEELTVGFMNGTAIAGIDGCWDVDLYKDILGKNFGVAKLPTFKVGSKNKRLMSFCGYKMYGVNANTKYPKASQALAYYLSSESGQKTLLNCIQGGPTNKKLCKAESVLKKPEMKAIIQQAKCSVMQKDILFSYWDPVATLGNKLYTCDPSEFNFTKLLEQTIKNINE